MSARYSSSTAESAQAQLGEALERTTRELAERTAAYERLRDEHEALRAALEQSEARSRAKSDFLSSMSHELRTPLNAILGFAQLLVMDRREPLSERHLERVEHILAGGQHLVRLIDDILDLSRVECGGVSIAPAPLCVADLLGDLLAKLGPLAARAGVRLRLAQVPQELPNITADPTRLLQILMNFGSNAIKYNREGGVVEFRAFAANSQHVRVLVTDTGLGIPANQQAKLFKAFQRAGQETGTIEGTGIGLFVSKRLAELMQGEVDFRSQLGVGSQFWVDMPANVAPITEVGMELGADVVAPQVESATSSHHQAL